MPTLDIDVAKHQKILKAVQKRIKEHIHHTPVLSSTLINSKVGSSIYFKCENFQKMGAFKMRGAVNAILLLTKEQREKGVVTHSSGNFAQAVALAGKILKVKSFIVMPKNAPQVKVDAVREYGGEIIFSENTIISREETANAVVNKTGATFLHPYNQYEVIYGQATAAIELIHQVPDLDIIIAPIGGGGLLSGTILAARAFAPEAKVIGSEPMGANDAYLSWKKGEIVPQINPVTIADGLRTSLGDLTFPIISEGVNDIICVSEEEIVAAMRLIWERLKIIIEPSSATVLAAIIKGSERSNFNNKKIGCILSGGNVDLQNLPF